MNRLAPLAVCLLMTMPAVFGGVEIARIEELAVEGGGVGGEERCFFAKGVVVARGD